jgi:hypothetical protein
MNGQSRGSRRQIREQQVPTQEAMTRSAIIGLADIVSCEKHTTICDPRRVGPADSVRCRIYREVESLRSYDARIHKNWNISPAPPLGREFTDESRAEILSRCLPGKNIQIAIGDVYQL